ncbi:MAG: hypothetical protein ACREO7_14615 [Pseudoxanthomonas sp.]
MKNLFLLVSLAIAGVPAFAKDKMIPLSEADAATLQGKKVALTVHERPTFVAMTAGKAGFGLLGVAAMASAGNKLVDDNHVQDPADIVRTQLAAALRDAYSAQLLPVDTVATKAKKPRELAALHPDADYVLDVRSGGWMYSYYPTRWGSYWVGYSVQVQLVDSKTGKQVSNVACNSNTHENPVSPSREQLLADEAKLLKDVTASLGWMCVQVLAKEQFRLSPQQVASIPAEYVDPLASITPTATEGTTAAAETASQDATQAGADQALAIPAETTDGVAAATDAPATDPGKASAAVPASPGEAPAASQALPEAAPEGGGE